MDDLSGRRREIEIIRDHLQTRKSLHLYGPAGVGKTTLLRNVIAGSWDTHKRAVPIYCDQSGSLRGIVLCITQALLNTFKHLKGLDKYLEPVELERNNDVEDENILNLRNIVYRYLKSGDFCVILDHLEKATPRIHSLVSGLNDCAPVITASRRGWNLSDLTSFEGSLALWHVQKLNIENLHKPDADVLMENLYELYKMNVSDRPGLFKDIYEISKGNPRVIETIFAKARDARYVYNGRLNLNLVVLDCRIDGAGIP